MAHTGHPLIGDFLYGTEITASSPGPRPPPARPPSATLPVTGGTHGLGAPSAGGHGLVERRLSRTRESRPFIYTPVRSKAGMYLTARPPPPGVKPSSPRASI